MSAPQIFDVPMRSIADFCLEAVAANVGKPAADLDGATFNIVQHADGSWTGRVYLATTAAENGPNESGGAL